MSAAATFLKEHFHFKPGASGIVGTTKGPGQGMGLRLSQVCGFANQSGGELFVQSTPDEGTTVTMILPSVDEEGDVLDSPAQAEPIAQAPAAILVVEDNEDVGAFAETLLNELGHRVTRASSGEEAIELARRQAFDVVLSDVVMPGKPEARVARAPCSPRATASTSSKARAVVVPSSSNPID